MARALAWLGAAGSVVAMIAYGLAAHRYSVSDDRSGGSYLLATVSIVGLLAMSAALSRAWLWLAAVVLAGLAFGLWFATQTAVSPTWVYLIQHAGGHAALAVFFAASLRGGREPVITTLARFVHGENLGSERAHYTRQVTLAWAIFFSTIAVLSLLLFGTNQMVWWSWLANVLALPLIAAMFIGEYLVRRRHLRHLEHVGITAGLRAWQNLRRPSASGKSEP